jgi:hypothetical protein
MSENEQYQTCHHCNRKMSQNARFPFIVVVSLSSHNTPPCGRADELFGRSLRVSPRSDRNKCEVSDRKSPVPFHHSIFLHCVVGSVGIFLRSLSNRSTVVLFRIELLKYNIATHKSCCLVFRESEPPILIKCEPAQAKRFYAKLSGSSPRSVTFDCNFRRPYFPNFSSE